MATYEFFRTFATTASSGGSFTGVLDSNLGDGDNPTIGFTFSTQSGNGQYADNNLLVVGTNPSFGGLSVTATATLQLSGTHYLEGVQLNLTSAPGASGAVSAKAYTTGGGTVTLSSGNAWTTGQNVTGIQFTTSSGGLLGIDSITSNQVVCFLEGTEIGTPEGAALIETLKPGDTLLTEGGETTVRWVGALPVDTRLSLPRAVNPIRIAAGALADGVPARDLFVSPDHGLFVGGALINAGALVNGTTIRQVAAMPSDGFTYYHIDTGTHEAILAEGTPAETFVDYAERSVFRNAAPDDLGVVAECATTRISSARLVPGHVRDAIAARECLIVPRAA